ncbi:MAG: hypothetical protein JXQ29_09480 [Planctomycetes bacterium]|nr:hypothetical protein [Planctomycetota bacterium]
MSLATRMPLLVALVLGVLAGAQCRSGTAGSPEGEDAVKHEYTFVAIDPERIAAQLAKMAPFELRFDAASLTRGEQALLEKIPEIGRWIDALWLEQSYAGNTEIFAALKRQYAEDPTPANRQLLEYYWINKGPYDVFELRPFLLKVRRADGVKELLGPFAPGRNFYPAGLTAEAFHAWAQTLEPAAAAAARSDFTVIRRAADGKLHSVPYAEAYREKTAPLAAAMRRAAAEVKNTRLADFLGARAEALEKTNDYEASEGLWIALNAPGDLSGGHLDITIGPYENYGDELMKRKAAFQLYVGVLRASKTKQLAFYEKHIHAMDDHLWSLYERYVTEGREVAPGKKLATTPVPERWTKPGAGATLIAVDLAYSAGFGNEGYQSLAYNLPNIAEWQAKFGSKKVMMMNLLDGKFLHILKPIASVVMDPAELANVDQELFSDNTVRHELAHGIGPSGIVVDGRPTTVRERHQTYYSPFEEAKAEIVSLLFGHWLAQQGLIEDPEFPRRMAATYVASAFRTVRFGTASDHARGKVFELNRLVDNGAIRVKNGKFRVDPERFGPAVEKLAMEILDVQVRGTMADAKALLEAHENAPEALTAALEAVNGQGIPVDLRVRYTFGDNYSVIADD